ncbi:MAG: hypothetical protein KC609_25585 [Myxococcales bacterium]|nr:hypothetical protein [Myxococcales bacterium]
MKRFALLMLLTWTCALIFGSACSSSSPSSEGTDSTSTFDSSQPPFDGSQGGFDTSTPNDLSGVSDTSTTNEDAPLFDPDALLEVGEPFNPKVDFPSKELHIAITSPSGSSWVAVSSKNITLGGLVFGDVFNINYQNSQGGQGSATGSPYWNSDPIELAEGDNRITVTVKNATELATDTIMVTYNPNVRFQGNPVVTPDALFKGDSKTICINIQIDPFSKVDAGTFRLLEVDKDGNTVKELAKLTDNGSLSNCDEIEGDSLFSIKVTPDTASEKRIYYRAAVDYDFEGQTKTAKTAVFFLDVFEKITSQQLTTMKSVQDAARSKFLEVFNTQGQVPALQAALQQLKGDSNVLEAGLATAGGYGLWVAYKFGIVGTIRLNPSGVRGGGTLPLMSTAPGLLYTPQSPYGVVENGLAGRLEVGSKRTIILGASHTELGQNDESTDIYSQLKASTCPTYIIDGPHYDAGVTVGKLRTLSQYGVIVFTGHGDALFQELSQPVKEMFGWRHSGSQEVLWVGEKPGTSLTNEMMIDLKRGRIAYDTEGFAILPRFFRDYAKNAQYPDSLVYLGSCRSIFNGTLTAAFIGNGAQSVFGYDQYVKNSWAFSKGVQLFQKLIAQKQVTKDAHNDDHTNDGGSPASSFRFFGNFNLSISDANFTNGLFAAGNLNGWLKDGDARVILRLGKTGPISGKFMAVISTGLGFTTETGSMKQTFCLPATVSQVSFYWKFYSEEFKNDFCCSSYDDSLSVTLTAPAGTKKTLLKTSVNTLCECGGTFGEPQTTSLIKSDVQFDKGDTWYHEWIKTTVDVTEFAGKGPVTLEFFTTDISDSIYDTAILIDKIEFK